MPGWRHPSCEEEALSRVEGADKLVDLYGYWPSFHDACVEAITVETEGPTVTIRFTTNDRVEKEGEAQRDELAVVTLQWEVVSELAIQAKDWAGESWVWDMPITLTGADIRTEILPNDDLGAVIVAERLKVMDVRPIEHP